MHYVGVRGGTLAVSQAFGVRQGLGEDFVIGQLLAQRLDSLDSSSMCRVWFSWSLVRWD